MQRIVMERAFDPALDEAAFLDMGMKALGCIDLYRATWHESLLAEDGARLVCQFEAPDAESIRLLTRGDDSREKQVWSGTLHGPDLESPANVIVARRFDEPASLDELQAREDAAAWCLQEHRVVFLRTLFSADRRRMLCMYQAPDAEAVRIAQRNAGMPVDVIWACRNYTPAALGL